MPRAQLKIADHRVLQGDQQVVEIHYEGKLIGVVYGMDGPGIRIMSKHPATPQGPFVTYDNSKPVGITEVNFDLTDIY